MKSTSMPSTAAMSSTTSRASRVSICTMVRRASLACCRYSVKDGMGLKRSGAMGEPKPRRPMGGNLAAWTSSLACSTVRSSGTRTYVERWASVWPRLVVYVAQETGIATYPVRARVKCT